MRPIAAPAIAFAVGLSVVAASGLADADDQTTARLITSRIEQVIAARDLGAEDAKLARAAALVWVHVGPCRGEWSGDEWGSAMQAVAEANPARQFDAAILEMVAVVMSYGGGRRLEKVCRFVADFAPEAAKALR